MPASDPSAQQSGGFFAKLRSRLNRGREWLGGDLRKLLGGKLDEATIEEIETRLLTADVGVEATTWLTEQLRSAGSTTAGDAESALEQAIVALLEPVEQPLPAPLGARPFVILAVGVNGTGKTTTLGKLAWRFREQGLQVVLAAADTFRAAAVEQLTQWAERTGADIVAQTRGADPAAVVHDALAAARSSNADVVLIDTAGRLHTAGALMDELAKIKRVVARFDAGAPHETMLVLDASQGQNALAQAKQFNAALGLTGLTVTKLDGTAKGGMLLAIARELAIPIRFLAVGEGRDDLAAFDARQFARALLGEPQA